MYKTKLLSFLMFSCILLGSCAGAARDSAPAAPPLEEIIGKMDAGGRPRKTENSQPANTKAPEGREEEMASNQTAGQGSVVADKESISNTGQVATASGKRIATANGAALYKKYCIACHQADGSGAPGLYPPLEPNKYVEDKDVFIDLMLNGLQGEIEVNGRVYKNTMIAHDHMTDEEIAVVISYVRSNFGNNLPAVTPEDVAAARAAGTPKNN